jgi:hypothetical protein
MNPFSQIAADEGSLEGGWSTPHPSTTSSSKEFKPSQEDDASVDAILQSYREEVMDAIGGYDLSKEERERMCLYILKTIKQDRFCGRPRNLRQQSK